MRPSSTQLAFNHLIRVLAAFFLLALTTGCEQSEVATPRPVVIQIAGATAMHPVLHELAAAFTERHSNVLIDIRGGGSVSGEARVREGRSVLGASTLLPDEIRPETQSGSGTPLPDVAAATPTAAPVAATATTGIELSRVPIGIDAVAVVVHSENPVRAFTSDQLQDIFAGRLLDWSELGGDDGEILLVSREDGSGTRAAFESRIMGDRAVSLTAVVMPTSADVVEYVSKNPRAIGYVSLAYTTAPDTQPDTDYEGSTGDTNTQQIRVTTIDGVLPSDETIRNQSYPLIQPLYLVTRGPPQGRARQLVDFALSPAGQAIVDHYHSPVR